MTLRASLLTLPFYSDLDGFECGDGWLMVIGELGLAATLQFPEARATQVKEKFGGLRVYHTEVNADLESLIYRAEQKAANTCEHCGASPAKLRGKSWVRTLCDGCDK